ncbi:MAG: hypothetical protein K6E20_07445 [Acholeplasmatales bacterium]|nr:hypothetical protein [Acholeplasmatales bacterium]
MIKTKEDLKYYLQQDRLALHIKDDKLKPDKKDEVWKYEIILRKHEYYHNLNKKNIFQKMLLKHYSKLHHKWSMIYTTSIPINVCGPGLSIAHFGGIYINHNSKIGKNLRIQTGVVIGGSYSTPGKFANIGSDVYIGTGAKILGGVTIANKVAIGANAVVTKDILEQATTHVGIPSHKNSDHSSEPYIDNRVFGK